MTVLVIDNFDSFTYNLVQQLGAEGAKPIVYRNNTITPAGVCALAPDRVLISPGPGGPEDSGHSMGIIRAVAGRIPVLGVCLGHQCIGRLYGCNIVRTQPMHGKVSTIRHDGKGVFRGLPECIEVARYHSLVVDPATAGPEIAVSAQTDDGIVMGLRHKRLPLEGVQFHPESFLTLEGAKILRNFLEWS
jgi:anthranilate synthase component 2/para-aminobenzoate synthetase component 2